MEKLSTKIKDAWILKPKIFSDSRGFFMESWNRSKFKEIGVDADFVQDNCSISHHGVLRGLHYQAGEAAQGKLVSVSYGQVYDVIVDLRCSSPTFGVWDGFCLSIEHYDHLWVPPGCAHGFLVLSWSACFHYKCTTPYQPELERSLRWDDPDLRIEWPLSRWEKPSLSDKDKAAPSFAECEKYE
jgi:dTDP-4-dehydrorhamnose 3,5-epimerase